MPKITVFGLGGSGTSTLAKEFRDKYGFAFMSSGGFFRDLAEENGMSFEDFLEFCKSHPEYDREVDRRTIEYGQNNDNFIFESRLAWHFIPDSLKVSIECSLGIRARRVAERDKIDFQTALEITQNRDEGDQLRYNKLYGITDYSDRSHFDFVLDSSSESPSRLAMAIYNFLTSSEAGLLIPNSKNL